jgi:hypothetical protein
MNFIREHEKGTSAHTCGYEKRSAADKFFLQAR